MKKILITGSNGLLGQNLIKRLVSSNSFEIFAISRTENKLINLKGFSFFKLDITNTEKLTEVVNFINPHHIIHTAAMTNVDECELNKEACEKINVETVKVLVELCENLRIHLIQISTDFIFDGIKGYYTEDDEPNPINYYGKSKLKSEQIIKQSKLKYTILRTILVFGLTENLKSNIVLWVMNNIENKNQISVVTDQLRMPTFVDDLVDACIFSIKHNIYGVYNVSSNKLLSIYDMAIDIANTFSLDKSFITPITTVKLNQPAKRPFITGFNLKKSKSELNLSTHSFYENLQVFKNQLANFKPFHNKKIN